MSPDLKQHLVELMWANAMDLQLQLMVRPGVSKADHLNDIKSVHDRCHMHCRAIQELGCHNDRQYGAMYDRIDYVATMAGKLLQEASHDD